MIDVAAISNEVRPILADLTRAGALVDRVFETLRPYTVEFGRRGAASMNLVHPTDLASACTDARAAVGALRTASADLASTFGESSWMRAGVDAQRGWMERSAALLSRATEQVSADEVFESMRSNPFPVSEARKTLERLVSTANDLSPMSGMAPLAAENAPTAESFARIAAGYGIHSDLIVGLGARTPAPSALGAEAIAAAARA